MLSLHTLRFSIARIQRASEAPFLLKTSTTDRLHTLSAIIFWLAIWQIIALLVGQKILLVGPVETLERLFEMLGEKSFYLALLFSLSRILLGLVSSFLLAAVFAFLSYRASIVRTALSPLVSALKATPVASITILILIWISSRNLSLVISFLMVFPIVYSILLEGLMSVDGKILEMADVFRIRRAKRIKYIFLVHLVPFIRSAISSSLPLCFKSAVAAEVIAIPSSSIGSMLYDAKLYLDTASLFALTVAIIILSFAFEKGLIWGSEKILSRIEGSL